jgi:hypothetical protein
MKSNGLVTHLATLILCIAASGSFTANAMAPTNAGAIDQYHSSSRFTISTSLDDSNIYGATTLSDDKRSGSSCGSAVTVTLPSGRTHTKKGKWWHARFSCTAVLSAGMKSEAYYSKTTLPRLKGRINKHRSFYGSRSTPSGTAQSPVLVRPIISISAVSPAKIVFDRLTGSPQSSTFNIALSYEVTGFPQPVYISVGLRKLSGDDFYSVNGRGHDKIPHSKPGVFDTAAYEFTPNLRAVVSGDAVEQIFIASVWKKIGTDRRTGEPIYEELSPTTDFEYGTRSVNISLSIPAP